ncbi:Cytochrome-c3 hydrogenase [Denitrovibrio acetiphilus DSM 12809]|uniref:Cytochrome-c3 hydrogenase n=1 Tax=Denitrovibrio acetiphilus (strain DSM 12809 / NBRC 114555 / N2460) TaxID=522772 RepID=D4H7J3_DENA2|nr:nickel-dependent hydrogenase large subunit [Denitrovibrio acetiphilus]ADD67992.1 Cytochrome-c3 hydrogenase [Denitrovibrio acetiphilus DSM 12809]
MGKRITIDPITRIEGHLRIDFEVDGGKVSKAWSSAQMWRGIEKILIGRDPRDAWVFAQRFCGVCTTVHAISSIRSLENAYNVEVPLNAQLVRNIMIAQHSLQDHIVHFYHLSALDWVDIVSALSADPKKTAQIAQSLSNWHGNSVTEFKAVKERLTAFVQTGKLGIFGSGYWGHPAMKLSPEVNLMAAAHYLKALDYQKKAASAVAILGGKDPHIQNLCMGGVATAINMDNEATLNMERVALLRSLMEETRDFVKNVLYPDVLAIGSMYKEWFKYGRGVDNYLAIPEFPLDATMTKFDMSGGIIHDGDLKNFRLLKDHKDEALINGTTESTKHAWYEDGKPKNPFQGETEPKYSEFDPDGKYTWCKAPRLDGRAIQVGPVAQILASYAAGDKHVKTLVDNAVSKIGITVNDLQSTMGRHVTRAIRSVIMADKSIKYLDMLIDNLAKGDNVYTNHVEMPMGEYQGVGFHEAPRGTLSHWMVINNGKLTNYQAVVPSTWNASPRDEENVAGPYEQSILGNPVADIEKPLEVIRTVHSFDPCIACAVHSIDPEGKEVTSVKVR